MHSEKNARAIQPRESLLGSARQRASAAMLRCREGPENGPRGLISISGY